MKRREFLELGLVAIGSLCMPLPSCQFLLNKRTSYTFTDEQKRDLDALLEILLPDTGDGVCATTINGRKWIEWTLADERYPPAIKKAIVNGLEQFRKYTKEKFHKNFSQLAPQHQIKLLQTLSNDGTLKYWIATLLTLLLEALLSHPIYGGNPQEIGWKWLGHTPGAPPPTPQTKYPELLSVRLKEKHMPVNEV